MGKQKSLLSVNDFGPISYEWMFMIFRDKYHGREGPPIFRIMGQLLAVGKVIYHELEPGVRNPEGAWGWLGKK